MLFYLKICRIPSLQTVIKMENIMQALHKMYRFMICKSLAESDQQPAKNL